MRCTAQSGWSSSSTPTVGTTARSPKPPTANAPPPSSPRIPRHPHHQRRTRAPPATSGHENPDGPRPQDLTPSQPNPVGPTTRRAAQAADRSSIAGNDKTPRRPGRPSAFGYMARKTNGVSCAMPPESRVLMVNDPPPAPEQLRPEIWAWRTRPLKTVATGTGGQLTLESVSGGNDTWYSPSLSRATVNPE